MSPVYTPLKGRGDLYGNLPYSPSPLGGCVIMGRFIERKYTIYDDENHKICYNTSTLRR